MRERGLLASQDLALFALPPDKGPLLAPRADGDIDLISVSGGCFLYQAHTPLMHAFRFLISFAIELRIHPPGHILRTHEERNLNSPLSISDPEFIVLVWTQGMPTAPE